MHIYIYIYKTLSLYMHSSLVPSSSSHHMFFDFDTPESWGVSPQTVSRRPREFMRVSPSLKLRWGEATLLKNREAQNPPKFDLQILKLKMGRFVWFGWFRWFSGNLKCRWSLGEPAVNLLGCMPNSCYFFGCLTKLSESNFWSRKKAVGTAFRYWQNFGRCSNSPQL